MPRLRDIARRLDQRLRPRAWRGVSYWRRRARRLGPDAVVNVDRAAGEAEEITELQRRTLLPLLAAELDGDERLALDLGCGPGRFTPSLAALIEGRAIGVDPVPELLAVAPQAPGTEYREMTEGAIPLADGEADVVWICLVIGAITEERVLERTLEEVDRVLAPRGVVFLAESTTERRNLPYWRFRSLDEYQRLFDFVELRHRGDYEDLDDRISVLSGRRTGAPRSASWRARAR